jgi:malonyl-CoA/methylmalonyl-CoA synthetase
MICETQTHGLFVATNVMLIAGGAMVFLPKLDVDQLIDWMPRATAMMGVPTFYTRLLGDERFDRDLTANMRLFISGSAPLLADTLSVALSSPRHQLTGSRSSGENSPLAASCKRRLAFLGADMQAPAIKTSDNIMSSFFILFELRFQLERLPLSLTVWTDKLKHRCIGHA